MSRKYNPYVRIMRAAKMGVGVNLSPDECVDMSFDDAIMQVAYNDLEAEGKTPEQIDRILNPARPQEPAR